MACSRCNNTTCTCYNPSDRYNVIGNGIAKYKLKSPIPDEVRDVPKVQSWFRKTKRIPFSGTTQESSHTYLKYLINLSKLSPTLSSCINGIKFYAFSGKPKIIKSVDSEFDFSNGNLNSEDLTLEVKNSIVSKLSQIDKGNMSWNLIATNLYNSYKSTGNAYLSVRIRKILDQTKIYLQVHEPETCLYKIPDLFESHKIDVSQSWDFQYLKYNEPETFSVYPYYDESEKEVKTMIHLKNGQGHYGRPDWFAASHDAFLEVKNKEYLLKAVNNNFTGQILIEFEEEQSRPILDDQTARESGWRNSADQWAGNFTNGGGSREVENPQSVLITTRPSGAAPVTVHNFNIQTQEKFFDTIGSIVERNIIKVNMWSKNLSGVDSAGGFSTDAFISELKSKLPVIEFYQDLIDNNLINTALNFIGKIMNDNEFIDNNIIHKSPFETILKKLINDNNPANTL